MSTKNQVLTILEKNRGRFISGQELAEELQITRSAVWKAVRALEERGLKVRAVRNRGYMLDADSDLISREGILSYLPERWADCRVILEKRVDSTNSFARRLRPDEAPHGTIIIAGEQTAGRGRSGKSFYSPAGMGLYMSVVLRPEARPERPQLITAAAAVSVCRAIEAQTELQPEIKWVNDILINDKKVCGILTEATTDFESGGMDSIVVGVGINCRTPDTGFPEDIKRTAGALDQSGLMRAKLAADVAAGILNAFENLDDKAILVEYKRRSIMPGKRINFVYNGNRVFATAHGFDDSCGLRISFDDGTRTVLTGGEVSIVRMRDE